MVAISHLKCSAVNQQQTSTGAELVLSLLGKCDRGYCAGTARVEQGVARYPSQGNLSSTVDLKSLLAIQMPASAPIGFRVFFGDFTGPATEGTIRRFL